MSEPEKQERENSMQAAFDRAIANGADKDILAMIYYLSRQQFSMWTLLHDMLEKDATNWKELTEIMDRTIPVLREATRILEGEIKEIDEEIKEAEDV